MPCTLSHRRAVGDTLSKFGPITLQNNGTARNLTGLTVKFQMYDSDGDLIVDAAATVLSASAGTVEYDFQSADVAVEGDYYGWFVVRGGTGGTEPDHYPDDDDGIAITIFDPTAEHTTAAPEISELDIIEAAKAPRRTRTVEGTVEERSINELIKADQYNASKVADTVPWGIRIAKSKPPSTLS